MAEIIRYVDTGATGTGDGTSWTDAYTSMSAMEAAEQQDLVAGGNTFTCYCRASTGVADTTPVIFLGWTTGVANDIKIIGESTSKWDASKYRFVFPFSVTTGMSLEVPNLTFDSIHVEHTKSAASATYTYTIRVRNPGITIKNCILKGVNDGAPSQYLGWTGVHIQYSDGICLFYNNILYDFIVGGAAALKDRSSGVSTVYAYNNTLYNNDVSLQGDNGNMVVKNSIIAATGTTLVEGTISSASDYNSFDTAETTGGANDRASQTFSFTDVPTGDFTLLPIDTGALDVGVDLSADPGLSIVDDIIGTARPQGSGYDIGSIETIGSVTYVDLNSTETTTVIETADLTVQSAITDIVRYVDTGATGTGDGTSWVNAYTALATMESSEQQNLVSTNSRFTCYCRASTGLADTTPFVFLGWTTSVTNTISLIGEKTSSWNTDKYRLEIPYDVSTAISLEVPYLTWDAIHLQHTKSALSSTYVYTLRIRNPNIHVKNSIIKGVNDGAPAQYLGWSGVHIQIDSLSAQFSNNIIYGFDVDGAAALKDRSSIGATVYAYNNTIYGNDIALHCYDSTLVLKNTLVAGNNQTLEDSINPASDYNAFDSVETTGGANDRASQTFSFVDAPSGDFSLLLTDTGALDVGADLSADPGLNISNDIIGTSRPQGPGYDIGSIETPEDTGFVELQSTELAIIYEHADLTPGPYNVTATIPVLEPFPVSVLNPSQTYYVDQAYPGASDSNDGSETNPWLTIDHAADAVVGGGKIIVKAGFYDERVDSTVGGVDGNWKVFEAQGSVTCRGFVIRSASYVAVNGFIIIDQLDPIGTSYGSGVWVQGDYVYVLNNTISGFARSTGVTSSAYSVNLNVQVENNRIFDCTGGVWVDGSSWLVINNNISALRYIDGGDCDYFRYFGDDIIFRDNYMHDTLQSSVGPSHVDFFQTFWNNQESHRILIENNLGHGPYVNQAVLIEGQGDIVTDITIRGNALVDMTSWGILVGAAKRITAYNNTIRGADTAPFGIAYRQGTLQGEVDRATGVVRDNIINNWTSDNWFQGNCIVEYSYNIVGNAEYLQDPTDILAPDPRFVNTADIVGPDMLPFTSDDGLRLLEDSPAIDNGTDGETIGAYLYASTFTDLKVDEFVSVNEEATLQNLKPLVSTETVTVQETADLLVSKWLVSNETVTVQETADLLVTKWLTVTEETVVIEVGILSVPDLILLRSHEYTGVSDEGIVSAIRGLSSEERVRPYEYGNLSSEVVDPFKDYFDRGQFDYGDEPPQVRDKDIENARAEADCVFNEGIYPDQECSDKAYLYLTAHFLQSDIQAGASFGQPDFLQTARTADGITEHLFIPDWMKQSDFVLYVTTYYGKKFLTISKPWLDGAVFVVAGGTTF